MSVCCAGGGEDAEAQAQEDNEDVTTKEDAKPDSLVSAYWETIGTNACQYATLSAVARADTGTGTLLLLWTHAFEVVRGTRC